MLFTLDKEHEVKSSCETPGTEQKQMNQTQSNFLTKTRPPKASSLHPQVSFTPTKQNMYKSSTIATKVPEEMAHTPVEIGTRGTVGSLIMKEIEYFSQLELSCQGSSQKPQFSITDKASSSSHSRPTLGSVTATQKKKNKGSRLLPGICSMVEVSDNNRPIGISGFSYRNLKSDLKKL